jgi:CDP-paratose 2-epimerase
MEERTGKRSELRFDEWRPSDQKVYISDITKAKRLLHWEPKTDIKEGVARVVEWVKEHESLFRKMI